MKVGNKVNAETIEVNELFYYHLVNQGKPAKELIEFINPFVPQMYDHNFFYLKEKGFPEAAYIEIERKRGKQEFLKFYGKIASTLKEAFWETPVISDYLQVEEKLVYLELVDPKPLSHVRTAITIQKVQTQEDFERYADFTYKDAKRISVSFAEEKLSFLHYLRELEEVQFFIGIVAGEVVGSLDVYQLRDYSKIENVYVEEAFRKQGIASGLIQTAVNEFGSESKIALATEVDGEALALYKNLGFSEVAYAVNELYLEKHGMEKE